MKKLFTALITLCFTALAGAGELRLADATGGAPLTALVKAGLDLALSGKLNLAVERQLPSEALKMLADGKLDAVIIDRRFVKKQPFIPFAAEALAVYCSAANPGTDLTGKQILEILLAPHPSWFNYNRLTLDIQRIIGKPMTSSGTLLNRIFGKQDWAEEIMTVETVTSGFSLINTGSMFFAQYVPLFSVEIKTLTVNGVMPTSGNIISGKYPLSLHYVIVYRENSAELQILLKTLAQTVYRQTMSDAGLFVMLPEISTEGK